FGRGGGERVHAGRVIEVAGRYPFARSYGLRFCDRQRVVTGLSAAKGTQQPQGEWPQLRSIVLPAQGDGPFRRRSCLDGTFESSQVCALQNEHLTQRALSPGRLARRNRPGKLGKTHPSPPKWGRGQKSLLSAGADGSTPQDVQRGEGLPEHVAAGDAEPAVQH